MIEAAPETVTEQDAARSLARKTWLARLAVTVVLIAAIVGIWYLLFARNFANTDNAYVNAEMAQITPLVSSSAIAVRVKDTQFVKRGEVLVELDPANLRIALASAEADLAAARRRFRQAVATTGALSAQVGARGADIARAQAQVAMAQADAEKARSDVSRREGLAGSGAISAEELTAARRADASARAALAAARASLSQAQSGERAAAGELDATAALVRGSSEETDPAVLAAKARVEAARLDMDRALIRAPIDGVVTRRQIQIGQKVAIGVPIMTIVPLDRVYVEANFKERQLRRVRVGQSAEVTADIYGSDVTYRGKVVGIAGGTGSSMAIIPAQNATGNWIKVVQRVPVRIELDARDLKAHPLRVGLSAEVSIDLSSGD